MIDLSTVSPERLALAKQLLTKVSIPPAVVAQRKLIGMPIDQFAAQHFFLEDGTKMALQPSQRVMFDFMFNPNNCPPFGFQTILVSKIKKSGKTAEAGLVARWISETWGGMNQVICVANDKEQSRGRIYQAMITSIQQDPNYDKARKILTSQEGIDQWRIIERDLLHIPTSSLVRAISGDHEGEAGSNPTATMWTEIWALRLERDKRLWAELTPVPTRARSIRYVETYAGYKGESNILWDLWQQATRDGKHLTIDDVPAWPFPPDDEEGHIPFYVNQQARLFAYIDQGPRARRMPWQQGAIGDSYYSAQAYALRNEPGQYDRLHNNYWIERASAFIPIQMWLNCYDPILTQPEHSLEAIAQKRTPCVIGADAAVSSDCIGLTLVHRHPTKHNDTCARLAVKWDPPQGGQFDYRSTIERTIKEWVNKFNIVEVSYDPTQLHHLMSELRRTDRRRSDPDFFPSINTREFSQMTERRKSDKRLYDMIRDQQMHHDASLLDLQIHLQNAGSEMALHEDTRLKIVKLDEGKIDLAVALSMANHRCMELLL